MVRRDAGAHEPPRRGEVLEHVDGRVDVLGGEQLLGGVEAGRAGSDDRDAKGEWHGLEGSRRERGATPRQSSSAASSSGSVTGAWQAKCSQT